MTRVLTGVIALAAVAMASACGGEANDDSDDPAGVSEAFLSGIAEGDADAACGLLSDDGEQDFLSSHALRASQDCAAVVQQIHENTEVAERLSQAKVEQATEDSEYCDPPSNPDTEAVVEVTIPGDVTYPGGAVDCWTLTELGGEWTIDEGY